MRKLEELGECPECGDQLIMFKTSSYKRFAKCESFKNSYPLPKRGNIHNSMLCCPVKGYPILIVQKSNSKAYFWADKPCFNCFNSDKCEQVQSLIQEFEELEVYGY